MKLGRLLLFTLLTVCVASASPVITFYSTGANVAYGHTGTISYSPTKNGAAAVGSNIDIDYLNGTGTVANNGVQAKCFGCVLNFQTGSVISDVSVGGTAWSFNGGGSFSITGAMDLNGNNVLDAGDIQPGTTLLAGIFNAPVSVISPGNPVQNDLKFVSATLITTMDNQLDSFYGNAGVSSYNGLYTQTFTSLRQQFNVAQHRWLFNTYGPTANKLTGMLDGSISNNLVVPEPVSMLLFGTAGLVAVVAARRRKSA